MRGGLQKRQIELVTLDDQGSAERARSNIEKLVSDTRVVALFGITSRSAAEVVIPIAESAGIAIIGAATGAGAIHKRLLKGVLNARAGYRVELARVVGLLKNIGFRDFAFVCMEDDKTKSTIALMQMATEAHGVRLLGSTTLRRDSDDVSTALAELNKLKPQIVLGVAAPRQYARLIRDTRTSKSSIAFASSSFAGETLLAELGVDGRGTIISQIVPVP